MPVLAIAGQQARAALGGHYQQELDLVSMFKDVAGAFVQQASTAPQVRHLIDRAVRVAKAERRVTALVIPNDLGDEPYEDPPRKHGTIHSGVGYTDPRTVPYEADLRRAADVLNSGSKVAILVGAGALHATDEVIAVANRLGAGVAKALLGKAVLPDDLPWVTGSIGLLGTKPSWEMMTGCDTLLMIGSGFPYSEFLPKEGQARAVQIDLKPDMLSLRYPMEVNLTGDSRETLRALLPLLREKTDGSWRTTIEKNVATWWKDLENRAMQSAEPVNPQRVAWELSPRLPERAIITSDSGSCANWYARDVRIRRGMMASLSGGLASMGAAVPYAIAAKFAHPDRTVVALVGDGAMQMNNMAELITVAKYWREWSNPHWVVCVFNNRDLNQVTWEQRVLEGDPKFEATQQIPDVPYHRFAELIGLRGIFVDTPERVGPAWEEALASDRPVVLEVKTDPNVPPLPPHITLAQAKAFMSTLVKGDPEEGSVLVNTAKEVLSSVLPGHRS
jgi:pyruvate dehydrogenase (quinone)